MARVKKEKALGGSPKTVEDILSAMRKEHGAESIMTFNKDDIIATPKISTGILALDLILGGGWTLGRIIEIFGPESSGKTTIALHSIENAQKEGKICAYIDAEHSYDPVYAEHIGIDNSQLLISQPNCGEEALDLVEDLIRTGAVGLIVVDSVAALVPKKELDGDFGDANVGLHARLMSQAMRKLTGPAAATGCIVIFINQLREKVGVMFGNPETTTGGRALRFYSSIRLNVRKEDTLKEGDDAYANRTRVTTVKNKTYPPQKITRFDIVYGKGVDNTGSIVDLAIEFGIVTKGGAWLKFHDCQMQGRPKLIAHLNSAEGAEDLTRLKEEVKEVLSRDMGEALTDPEVKKRVEEPSPEDSSD